MATEVASTSRTKGKGRKRAVTGEVPCPDLTIEDIVAVRERYTDELGGRDYALLCILLPDTAEGIGGGSYSHIFHRPVIGPPGTTEQLLKRGNILCDELDPDGAIARASKDTRASGNRAEPCNGGEEQVVGDVRDLLTADDLDAIALFRGGLRESHYGGRDYVILTVKTYYRER